MRIISYLNNDLDVIQLALNEIKSANYVNAKKADIETKCLDKIIPCIKFLIYKNLKVTRPYTDTIDENIIEFRIELPKSKYLLRIFAALGPPDLILLTGHLTKPEKYDDTHQKKTTNQEYEQEILQAKDIWTDYTSKIEYDYQDITLYIMN